MTQPALLEEEAPVDVAAERDRYVELCLTGFQGTYQTLRRELTELDQQLAALGAEALALFRALQRRPGTWLERVLPPPNLERLAAGEFDTLATAPGIAAIGSDPATKSLVISAFAPGRRYRARRFRRITVGLDSGAVSINPRPRELWQRTLAPLLAAAGQLPILVTLVTDLPPQPGAESAPNIAERAREDYVRWRVERWLHDRDTDQRQIAAETRLAELTGEMAGLLRRAGQAARTLEDLPNQRGRVAERHALDFELLQRVPGVVSMRVVGKCIHVDTEPIVLSTGAGRFAIGRFRIEIGLQQRAHGEPGLAVAAICVPLQVRPPPCVRRVTVLGRCRRLFRQPSGHPFLRRPGAPGAGVLAQLQPK